MFATHLFKAEFLTAHSNGGEKWQRCPDRVQKPGGSPYWSRRMGRTATKEEKEKGGWLSRAGRMFEKILKRFFVRKKVQRWWFVNLYTSTNLCHVQSTILRFVFCFGKEASRFVGLYFIAIALTNEVFLGGWAINRCKENDFATL